MKENIISVKTKHMNYAEVYPQASPTILLLRQENSYPDLMTEEEVIEYLRIPCVSNAKNHKYVIDHLIRYRDLPCIHISRKRLFPRELVQDWILRQYGKEAA